MTAKAQRHFTLTMLLLLGACAIKPMIWQKSNSSDDDRRAALSQCRSYAITETDRDFKRRQNNASSGSLGQQSTYQQNMTTFKAGKSKDHLLARCMKLKGYRQVPATN